MKNDLLSSFQVILRTLLILQLEAQSQQLKVEPSKQILSEISPFDCSDYSVVGFEVEVQRFWDLLGVWEQFARLAAVESG
jgi:hypothetical protein